MTPDSRFLFCEGRIGNILDPLAIRITRCADEEISPVCELMTLLSSLLIGVPSIDQEHEALVTQLNSLVSDSGPALDSARFSECLSQLGGQITSHFSNEEAFFKSVGMPESEVSSHVQAHTEIIDQYILLNLGLMQGQSFVRADVLRMIKDWIIGHVVRFDLNIKRYLPDTALTVPE